MESPKITKIKRIPESSEEYQLERKKNKEYNERYPQIAFGERALKRINNLKDSKTNPDKHIVLYPNIKDKISDVLENERINLLELCEKRTELFVNFIKEAMTNFDLQEKVVRLISTANFEDTPVDQAVVFLKNNFSKLPNDLLEEMLRFHVAEFQRKSAEFRRQLPELISRFKSMVERAVLKGWLPVNVELLEKRIHNEINFMLYDNLTEPDNIMLGGYNIIEGIIKINSTLSESERENVIDHELTHVAISGRAIVKSETEGSSFGSVTIHQKFGLGFENYKKPDQKLIFTWLNEAVTESISMLLREGNVVSSFYVMERNILKDLIGEGMSQDLILDAYCETEIPEIEGVRVPAWKKFIAKLNEMKNGKGITWLQKKSLECDEYYEKNSKKHEKK